MDEIVKSRPLLTIDNVIKEKRGSDLLKLKGRRILCHTAKLRRCLTSMGRGRIPCASPPINILLHADFMLVIMIVVILMKTMIKSCSY